LLRRVNRRRGNTKDRIKCRGSKGSSSVDVILDSFMANIRNNSIIVEIRFH
jgi:hypothetical protein